MQILPENPYEPEYVGCCTWCLQFYKLTETINHRSVCPDQPITTCICDDIPSSRLTYHPRI